MKRKNSRRGPKKEKQIETILGRSVAVMCAYTKFSTPSRVNNGTIKIHSMSKFAQSILTLQEKVKKKTCVCLYERTNQSSIMYTFSR